MLIFKYLEGQSQMSHTGMPWAWYGTYGGLEGVATGQVLAAKWAIFTIFFGGGGKE